MQTRHTWVVGSFLLMRRACYEDVGELDERFFIFDEDVDWCLRAKRAGWKIRYWPGAKMIHAADETTSNIVAKSISVGQGRSTYRGVVHIPKHLKGCKNNTECDALLINTNSRTDTYPAISVRGDRNATQHEASVSKVSEDMIFYMQSRGLTEAQAMSLAVNGFINELARQFPMEYSVELKRLIDLEMEGSVG